ncbi:hypothetical protein RCH10_004506 [Variovorax sp. GrIS 2.14]|uniref:hypothetical protein n=1 Tax=Variovorax sp. GrIS 2.14 TaxID=3071709 RepID=UPI0038F7C467
MSILSEHDQLLRRLCDAALPCAVEGFEAVDLICSLVQDELLQAILPPWDEASRSYSGSACVVRLTQKGIDAADNARRAQG